MSNKLELYHGSGQIVEFPEIRKTRYTKDFSWGFYCTNSYQQAHRWAERKHENGIVNVYSYTENNQLNIKKFEKMTNEWLDFIAECRAGKVHAYDIVEGPMADDTIWNFVNDYLNKNIAERFSGNMRNLNKSSLFHCTVINNLTPFIFQTFQSSDTMKTDLMRYF